MSCAVAVVNVLVIFSVGQSTSKIALQLTTFYKIKKMLFIPSDTGWSVDSGVSSMCNIKCSGKVN
jgi:hypothetical protein